MSESHTIISDVFDAGIWTPARFFGNWTTAVNTRSLSFCLLNKTILSSNSTLNLALLFYENPTGKISALLQRENMPRQGATEWIDITSQGTKSLPDGFHIGPDLKYDRIPTLYETNTNATFSTLFTCTEIGDENYVQLLFYSPNSTDPIKAVGYQSSSSSSDDSGFAQGMYCAYLYPQKIFLS